MRSINGVRVIQEYSRLSLSFFIAFPLSQVLHEDTIRLPKQPAKTEETIIGVRVIQESSPLSLPPVFL